MPSTSNAFPRGAVSHCDIVAIGECGMGEIHVAFDTTLQGAQPFPIPSVHRVVNVGAMWRFRHGTIDSADAGLVSKRRGT
jgi:hypothetical protein